MVKLEKVKERALCYIYKNKQASYGELLAKKGETKLENRRIQDTMITINNYLINKAPLSIKNLILL